MRILMTAHTFYPEGRGGVEKHILSLARYLIEANHEVGIFYRIHSPDQQEYALIKDTWSGIQVFKVVHNFVASMPNPFPFYDLEIEEQYLTVVEAFRPDLVHIHHLGGLSTSLVSAAKRRALPVLWTLHDFWPMCPLSHLLTPNGDLCAGPDDGLRCVECVWLRSRSEHAPLSIRARLREIGWRKGLRRAPGFLKDFIAARIGHTESVWDRLQTLPARNDHMRSVLLDVDLLISPSQFLIDRFEAWGIPRSKFRYLQNGVPAALLSGQHRDQVAEGRDFVFGFIGSICPNKGVHILVEAFLQADLPDTKLRIWGGAEPAVQDYLASVRKKAASNGRIAFEGRFDPDTLMDVLKQIDVLVVPSILYENNPLAILESFAMKTPVIASNVGGMAELVQDDWNGLLFRVGDPANLADKMRKIRQPGHLDRYGSGITPPQSVHTMGAALEQIYSDLLD